MMFESQQLSDRVVAIATNREGQAMGSSVEGDWLQLILNVPSVDRELSQELWCALDSLGCVTLGDGIHVLPARAQLEVRLREVAQLASSLGTQVWVLRSNAIDRGEDLALTELFARDSEYATWLEDVFQLQCALPQLPFHDALSQCRRLGRELSLLRAIDFFPNEISREATRAWGDLFTQVQEVERSPIGWATHDSALSHPSGALLGPRRHITQ
jgi:hypothetical protein